MESSGLKANFINGLRVTDEATIAIVKKTLDEIVNKDVCEILTSVRANPKGLAGDSVLVCEKLTVDDDGKPIDLGYVGDVTEVKVKMIKKEIADGFMPVISPVAEGLDGKPYNVNADVAAGVKQQLENDTRRVAGVRLLPGRFMVINQAMASQKGKEAGARYLREFVEDVKASGFVAKAIERHKQPSAVVAPLGFQP